MKTVCAWCKKEMKAGSPELSPEGLVSHGICTDCIYEMLDIKRMPLMDYLDSLGAPILVVNADGCIDSANKLAREILQKTPAEIDGRKGGDVFECAYAKLPEGCGNTIHCDACTIRNTVMDTHLTGNPHIHAKAYLIQGTPDDNQEIKFLISTQKVANVVLLRIDKVGSH